MTTLIEAPAQLQGWIRELDGQIGYLSEQRDALVVALELVGGEQPVAVATPKPAGQKVALDVDEYIEKRRAADRDRKARARAARQRPKAKTAAGGSKYDYAEVARVACAAVRDGVALGPAAADYFGVTPSMGSWLINEARRRGHNIPRRMLKPLKLVDNHVAVGGPAFTPDDALGLLDG